MSDINSEPQDTRNHQAPTESPPKSRNFRPVRDVILPPLDLSLPQPHPFASSSAKLEVLPDSATASGIDIEEEIRLYDELCRTYEDNTEEFSRLQPSLSSRPADSIFSADIYLADNTGGGSFASDVKITGWATVAGDKVPSLDKGKGMTGIGTGAYVVYDCVITTKEHTTFHILKRYSAFEQLDHSLRRSLPHVLQSAIPILPPKAPLARFRPAFLDRRRQHLQFWLARVLLHPEVGRSEPVRRWVTS